MHLEAEIEKNNREFLLGHVLNNLLNKIRCRKYVSYAYVFIGVWLIKILFYFTFFSYFLFCFFFFFFAWILSEFNRSFLGKWNWETEIVDFSEHFFFPEDFFWDWYNDNFIQKNFNQKSFRENRKLKKFSFLKYPIWNNNFFLISLFNKYKCHRY